jgi:hypothetical protein
MFLELLRLLGFGLMLAGMILAVYIIGLHVLGVIDLNPLLVHEYNQDLGMFASMSGVGAALMSGSSIALELRS